MNNEEIKGLMCGILELKKELEEAKIILAQKTQAYQKACENYLIKNEKGKVLLFDQYVFIEGDTEDGWNSPKEAADLLRIEKIEMLE